jgi:aldehyde:ferredoxin oxidoreductase
MDIDEHGLTEIARRVINLVRSCNLRFGLARKDDTVPKLFFQRTPILPMQTLDPDKFDRYLDRFYAIRGWTDQGVPTRETLRQLNLDDVGESLDRSGIIR